MHDLSHAMAAPRPAGRHAARATAAPADRRPARTGARGPARCAVLLLAGAALVALGGCASSAGIAPVVQPLAPEALGLGAASAATAGPVIEADWWRRFGDSRLDALVERALADQPDLQAVQARLTRAQATVAGLSSAGEPVVNASLDATRQHFSAHSIYPAPLGGSLRTLGTLQAGGSWEIDVFGRQRAALPAGLGDQRAASAELQAARLALASALAQGFVQLGRLFDQRQLAERALAQRTELLALTGERVRAGLDTGVEQRQAEGALPEARLQVEQIDEQLMLLRHRLAALSAQPPDALDGLTASLDAVLTWPLPDSVPADLLGRRPDVEAARWRVEAAGHGVEQARLQFYPNINLSAFAGLASIGLDRLLDTGSAQYGFGPAIRLPLFDAGRLRANLRGKAAEVDAAVAGYNAAVLGAVHDPADRIGALRAIARQQPESARALAAAESAHALLTQRYRAGLGNYLQVLDAEAAVLARRRQAADLKARALEAQVALVRALGGGYLATAAAAGAAPAEAGR